jgi:L-cystine transport system substrate-binding protein
MLYHQKGEFRMKRTIQAVFITSIALAAIVIAAGCSNKNTKQGSSAENSGDIIIRAATESTYPPFSYLDENNQLTGYDVEVVKAIGERLKGTGYTLEVQALSADALLLALESRKIDIFFDEMAITPSRQERFYFSEPYYRAASYIVVPKGNKNIRNLKDLEGKTVGAYVGDVQSQFIEKYNETASTPIKIVLIDSGTEEATLLNLQNGRYDAHLNDPVVVNTIIARNKLDLEIVGDPIFGDQIGLIFTKDEPGLKLKNLIDPIIKDLRADGTLSKLALQFTGIAYNPE